MRNGQISLETRHTSMHAEVLDRMQEAADAGAVNALNMLAEWLATEKGMPKLAQEMLDTFGAPSEGDEPAQPAAADLFTAPADEPAPEAAKGPDAILIKGEH
jgi:hypothetical protein